MDTERSFQVVKGVFTQYLEKHKHRKTLERYSILEEIYNSDIHLDIDTLYDRMRNKYRVSRATIYNTIELLLECKLIRKHQFAHSTQAFYEKSYFDSQHDHVICDDGEVLEFCDPRIQSIKQTIEDIFKVEITGHSLYFYAKKKEQNKENQES